MKSKHLFGQGLFVLASIFCLVFLISTAKSEAKSCKDKCRQSWDSCCTGCDVACVGSPSITCEIVCENRCAKERDNCDKKCTSTGETEQKTSNPFSRFDKDNDGYLSKDEVRAMAKDKKKDATADKAFEEMDKNKDGKVSHEEVDAMPVPEKVQEKFAPKKGKK